MCSQDYSQRLPTPHTSCHARTKVRHDEKWKSAHEDKTRRLQDICFWQEPNNSAETEKWLISSTSDWPQTNIYLRVMINELFFLPAPLRRHPPSTESEKPFKIGRVWETPLSRVKNKNARTRGSASICTGRQEQFQMTMACVRWKEGRKENRLTNITHRQWRVSVIGK